jgi:hypothetical protein
MLSKLFGFDDQQNNAADAANQYLNQIPKVAKSGFQPYVNQGREADTTLQSQFSDLIKDPTALINKLMQAYAPSEGYQFQKDLLSKEMANTAAAGGIAGTPLDQFNQAKTVQGLLSQDMQQFLANALGLYGTGLEGNKLFSNRGYDASSKLTDILSNNLTQQGGLAFNNAQQQQKNNTDLWNMFGKALGAGLSFLPGGSFIGPAVGALAGPMSGTSVAPWRDPGS